MTLGTQTLKSTHSMPKNKPVSLHLSYLLLTCSHATKKFLGQKAAAFLPPTPHNPILREDQGSGPSENTHLCPHWQTSQASLPRTAGPLLLQACVQASRERHSGLSPSLTYEVRRCSCNALLLDTTKSTCSTVGQKREHTKLTGGSSEP